MNCRDGHVQPKNEQRSKVPPHPCDLGKRLQLAVCRDLYLKPNLGCALQKQRIGSMRCAAGRLDRPTET
jgi:hypothetical protein